MGENWPFIYMGENEMKFNPVDVTDRDGVGNLENPKGSIEFRHLTFRYPDGDYSVLQDVSFQVAAGESVGIVGKTGAGKTTVVDLLLRTYNVPDGTLFVDRKDVNSVSIHSVRNACAYEEVTEVLQQYIENRSANAS